MNLSQAAKVRKALLMMTFLGISSAIFTVIFRLIISSHSQRCSVHDGFVRDAKDCSKFFYCQNGMVISTFQCEKGAFYDQKNNICDWIRDESQCINASRSSKSSTLGSFADSSSSNAKKGSTPAPTTLFQGIMVSRNNDSKQSTHLHEYNYESKYVIVCYFTNWASNRSRINFVPENVNVDYCTHINYAFVVLDEKNLIIKLLDPWIDVGRQFMKRIIKLKQKNASLKVLLSIGGWVDSAGDKYSRLVNSSMARKNFITHALQLLRKLNFDGLDLDWEYPKCWQAECAKGPESDKYAFATFVQEIKQAFRPHGLLVTAAVSPSYPIVDAGYDVQSLAKNLDFINVMAYDYHGQWEKFASYHAPLYARPESQSFDPSDQYLNINFTIHHWMKRGMPSRKLVLGIPLYGRTFTLTGPASSHPQKGFGMSAIRGGEPGRFTRERGFLSYYEICDNVRKNGWTVGRDGSGAAFAYHANQWVGYDDPESLRKKSEYIRQMNLLGGMVWALDLDDFSSFCCNSPYPLMRTLNAHLRGMEFPTKITCV
ncbi:chitinase-3-like protein 1 [Brevipalpus obovatus]|uniref:chitinase-3-like protein 1 n=1 Tax=Brevipalpus obovatus TaxID=246614 RepID=UPI003D9F0E8C